MESEEMLAGGLTEPRPADTEIQEIANKVSGYSPWQALMQNLDS